MKKTKNTKNVALNGGKKENCFFKAFFWGVAFTFAAIVLLCLAVAGFLSRTEDSTGLFHILPTAISGLALFFGGIVCTAMAKGNGMGAALMCGCAFLGISYALSAFFNLGGEMQIFHKTVCVLVALLSPVIGAKVASSGAHNNTGLKRKKRGIVKKM